MNLSLCSLLTIDNIGSNLLVPSTYIYILLFIRNPVPRSNVIITLEMEGNKVPTTLPTYHQPHLHPPHTHPGLTQEAVIYWKSRNKTLKKTTLKNLNLLHGIQQLPPLLSLPINSKASWDKGALASSPLKEVGRDEAMTIIRYRIAEEFALCLSTHNSSISQ